MGDLDPRFEASSLGTASQEYRGRMAEQNALGANYLQQQSPLALAVQPVTAQIMARRNMSWGDTLREKFNIAPDGTPMGPSVADAISAALWVLPGIGKRPIRGPSDNISNVMSSNFSHPILEGDRMMPVGKLTGGVRMSSPAEVNKVNSLVDAIKSENGYFARPVVDELGNVIEGQHRLEAARQLGARTIPVTMVRELARDVDVPALRDAIRGAGKLHPDQVNQIIQRALETAREAGGAQKALGNYELPGFQSHFDAALKFLAGK